MSKPRVFVDATCIFSRTERDWLFALRRVTEGRMFHIVTSEDVLAEALAKLRDRNPLWDGGQISSIRKNVIHMFDEVLDDFPGDIPFPGVDVGDTHVHAAAIHAGATMVVTSDTGFLQLDEAIADELPYEAICADALFLLIDDSSPGAVREAAQLQINHYESKGESAKLVPHLEKAGCPLFAERVHDRIKQLVSLNPMMSPAKL